MSHAAELLIYLFLWWFVLGHWLALYLHWLIGRIKYSSYIPIFSFFCFLFVLLLFVCFPQTIFRKIACFFFPRKKKNYNTHNHAPHTKKIKNQKWKKYPWFGAAQFIGNLLIVIGYVLAFFLYLCVCFLYFAILHACHKCNTLWNKTNTTQ